MTAILEQITDTIITKDLSEPTVRPYIFRDPTETLLELAVLEGAEREARRQAIATEVMAQYRTAFEASLAYEEQTGMIFPIAVPALITSPHVVDTAAAMLAQERSMMGRELTVAYGGAQYLIAQRRRDITNHI